MQMAVTPASGSTVGAGGEVASGVGTGGAAVGAAVTGAAVGVGAGLGVAGGFGRALGEAAALGVAGPDATGGALGDDDAEPAIAARAAAGSTASQRASTAAKLHADARRCSPGTNRHTRHA